MPVAIDRSSSYWVAHAPECSFGALAEDLHVDVAIIGGGIVGLTTAACLRDSGLSVAVIEADRIGRGATGHSTAKVTSQHGLIYADLIRSHGEDGARLYAGANQAAVELVAGLVAANGLDCDFRRKDAWLYTCNPARRAALEQEADAARRLGLPAELTDGAAAGLPFEVAGALRFDGQAQIQPACYLVELARTLGESGIRIFQHTRVTAVDQGDPHRLAADRHTVTANHVVVATHMPVISRGMFFARAYPRAHPVLAASARGHLPEGMYLSIDDPTLSVVAAGNGEDRMLVATGGAFKPGHAEEARACMRQLQEAVRSFGVDSVACCWTNEDYTSMDRVPFVGRASDDDPHLFVATGFGAWGLSNGTAAGQLIANEIAGRTDATAAFFAASRSKPLGAKANFLKENVEVATHLVGDYVKGRPRDLEALGNGEAGIFKLNGESIAAFRDGDGKLHQASAVCTHLKCLLGWNPIDRTWDCHCHGSRFTPDGQVLHGPAVKPLSRPRSGA